MLHPWSSPPHPTVGAQGHGSASFADFLGVDGSATDMVDAPAAPGMHQCSTCHDEVTTAQTEVVMPSGPVLAGLGHEYPGQHHEPRFEHVSEFKTHQSCHDPHALDLDVAGCATYQTGVESVADLRSLLMTLIQTYVREIVGRPTGYSDANPHSDLNDDGAISADERTRANAYAAFQPRVLAATYADQVAKKDPGSYVHNGQYVVQLLHDSLFDLGWDVSGMDRPDAPF